MQTYNNTPLFTGVLLLVGLLAAPILLFMVFDKYSDSITRQIIVVVVIVTLLLFSLARCKQEKIALGLIFCSQFEISFYTVELDEPVGLSFLLFDLLFIGLAFCFLELRERIRFDRFSILLSVLLLWQFVLVFFSAHTDRSIVWLLWQFKFLMLYLIFSNLKFGTNFYRLLPKTVGLIVIVQATIVIAQYIQGGYIGLEVLGARDPTRLDMHFIQENLRAAGTLGAANALGGYFAILLVFLLPYVISRFSMFYSGAFILGLVGIYIPLSRAGWLSFMLCAGLLVLQMFRSHLTGRLRIVVMSAAVFMLGSSVAIMNIEQIRHRFEDENAISSAEGRYKQIPFAWSATMQRPILGIGPGVTDLFGRWTDGAKYVDTRVIKFDLGNQFHNSILQYFVEAGLPGGLLFTLFVILVFVSALKKLRRNERGQAIQLSCAMSAAAYLVHTQFGTEIANIRMMTLFICMLALSNNRHPKEIMIKRKLDL